MSRKTLEKKLAALLSEHGGGVDIPAQADDIFGALGMDGAARGAFLDAYAAGFNVNLSDFLWYLHTPQEGPRDTTARQVAYLPNGKRAPYQPITFENLLNAAETGQWVFEYPEHRLKTVGWKDYVQYILIAVVALWIVASIFI